MKIFSLILITLFVLTGCTYKQPEPVVKTVVVTEIKEVKVPVPCKVPKVTCDFNAPGFSPINKMLECIIMQKRALESISKSNQINQEEH